MGVITYREALNQALREEMRRDPTVIILGEDVGFYGGSYKVTENLYAEFGDERVIDTPICENSIVGAAIGAALAGLRPVAELMTINFALLAMDEIVNHAAKIRYMFGGQVCVPLVIRAPAGAGKQTAAQHSQSLHAYFMHCPGLKLASPSAPADAKGMLKSAIRDPDPVVFIEHELLYRVKGEVPEDENFTVPLGLAEIKRPGSDVTVIAYSKMVYVALEAAEILERDRISVEVIDMRSIIPMDMETILESIRRTRRALFVEEDWRTGGVGAEVAARIYEAAFDYLDAPVGRIGGLDVPMPYARNLESLCIPQTANKCSDKV